MGTVVVWVVKSSLAVGVYSSAVPPRIYIAIPWIHIGFHFLQMEL